MPIYSTNSPMGITIQSTAGDSYYTATDMCISTSTNAWNMISSDYGEFDAPKLDPVISIEFCNWCQAEYYPGTFRPGACICCGGPKNVK